MDVGEIKQQPVSQQRNMDQYKRGCGVKRLFLIQACVSVSEVSLDSSCAVGRYGSVFKKRSKTLRDHKRLVKTVESGRLTPRPQPLYTQTQMHPQLHEHTHKSVQASVVTVQLLCLLVVKKTLRL